MKHNVNTSNLEYKRIELVKAMEKYISPDAKEHIRIALESQLQPKVVRAVTTNLGTTNANS